MTKAPTTFDDVMEIVGSVGKYQRFFLYGILFPLTICEALFSYNFWILMDEPLHWCHVPGRNEHEVNLEQWKNLTIPKFENGQYSKCNMYNISSVEPSVLNCTYGWEYDFSTVTYRSILVEQNWVCDKADWPTWVYTANNAGRAVGTFVFGVLADKIGRKAVFIITLVLYSFGRAISLYFVENFGIFVALTFIVGLTGPMFAVSVNMIGIELSGKEYRAWIYSFVWMTIVIGIVIVAGLAYITPNWFVFGWATILLGSISYLLLPWIPESPRWLLTKGRVPEVVKILQNIAKWNKPNQKISNEELEEMLTNVIQDEEVEDNQSILKLFSTRRIATLTLLVIFTWMINSLLFDTLSLNSYYLHGNRFVNFILVSLVEVPGSYFAGLLSEKFGRRWMQVLSLCLAAIWCAIAAYFSEYAGGIRDTGWATTGVIVAANFAKFAVTMSFLVIYLQAVEVFPTALRSTGSGLASTVSSVVLIAVPLIVFTGKSSQSTPWIVGSALSFVGMITASFIPETMNLNLPKSLSDTEELMKQAKFWSFGVPKSGKKYKIGNGETNEIEITD